MNYDFIRESDPDIYYIMEDELERQRDHIELIASENFTSEAVMEAMGSHLTNKYAEGYPGARFYGGCENVDHIEKIAIRRAKTLYKAEYANVQPHAGSQANVAVYAALLQPGDTILGMSLDAGGHLTHGARASITGRYWNAVTYGVNAETEMIDYDDVLNKAKECQPQIIVAGASAYPRFIDWAKFREIADEVGAYFMVDIAHIGGLVAAGVHPSPVPYADAVTSTTHKTLRGPRGGIILIGKDFDDPQGRTTPKGVVKKMSQVIDSYVFPGVQGGPLEHVIAAKAVAFFEAQQPEFVQYQKQVIANAKAMCDEFLRKGYKVGILDADVGFLSGGQLLGAGGLLVELSNEGVQLLGHFGRSISGQVGDGVVQSLAVSHLLGHGINSFLVF